MNVCMEYLYRDAGNYKSFGAVVVANAPDPISPADAEAVAHASLIDGSCFVAAAAGLPDLRAAEWDDDLDHDWHELHGFTETAAPPDDPRGRDIRELLADLSTGAVSHL